MVQLGRFRGQIEVEEAGFFVRSFDAASGRDRALGSAARSRSLPESLHVSARDGALLCRVKRDLIAAGLLARFGHAAQAQLLGAVEERDGQVWLEARRAACWRCPSFDAAKLTPAAPPRYPLRLAWAPVPAPLLRRRSQVVRHGSAKP